MAEYKWKIGKTTAFDYNANGIPTGLKVGTTDGFEFDYNPSEQEMALVDGGTIETTLGGMSYKSASHLPIETITISVAKVGENIKDRLSVICGLTEDLILFAGKEKYKVKSSPNISFKRRLVQGSAEYTYTYSGFTFYVTGKY